MKNILNFFGLFLFLLSISQPVFSHGTVIYPPSRIYNCYNNSSISVCSPCGGAIYDWMGVLQPHTNYGNHQALIPDGQIASGGNGSAVDFSCLDALTADWPTTIVSPGNIDVKWQNTAPHKTQYYKVYITALTWDPTQPLRWNELIEIGHVGQGPPTSFTTIRSFIPDSYAGKRAALVSVWQRNYNDSHEAFYSVSDILVQGNGGGCNIGDPVSITFDNNTDCTLRYYQNNSFQGSANVGGSYTANTTVGSQWQAQNSSGNQIDNFTIICDQTNYASTGECNSDDGCDGIAIWSSTTTYFGGENVKYNNSKYRARWWTLNQAPNAHMGDGQPWEKIGSCTDTGGDNITPTVSITSPANGTSFNEGNSITITASASDSDGSIAKVEFFNGGIKLGEDTTSPYNYTISNSTAGNYTLSAKATDNKNGATTSTMVSVTVIGDTSGSGCGGIVQYVVGNSYSLNQEVLNENSTYTCDIPGWCSSSAAWAYAPGTGLHWQSAWSKSGDCEGTKSSSLIALNTYPNPINSILHISVNSDLSDSNFNLKIYTISGAKVLDFTNNSIKRGNNLKDFDLSQLKSGLYLYTISIAKEGIYRYGKIQKK